MTEEKKAAQGRTEIVFILDRSGSMSGLESDTIGGFNGMLRRQQEESTDILVSTVLFDDEVEVIHDRVPIEKVAPLTGREYFTRGCTALLDAIGDSIQHIRNIHKYAREEDRPVRTMFVITTDGLENSSVHYTAKKIKKLIGHQEESMAGSSSSSARTWMPSPSRAISASVGKTPWSSRAMRAACAKTSPRSAQ